MRTVCLSDMVRGWLVGDFAPAALRTSACEVAIKHYRGGDREDLHHHRQATELTAIVSGEVEMFARRWTAGDVIVIEPGEATAFLAVSDAVTVVVKVPGVTGDKVPGRPDP